MWIRENNTARSILNIRDASCGMWTRLPEGDFVGFSGKQGLHPIGICIVLVDLSRYVQQAQSILHGDIPMKDVVGLTRKPAVCAWLSCMCHSGYFGASGVNE
jgi:hypothetical protein